MLHKKILLFTNLSSVTAVTSCYRMPNCSFMQTSNFKISSTAFHMMIQMIINMQYHVSANKGIS